MTRTLTMLLAGLLLGACASKPPLEDNSDFAPIRPLEPAANALPTGSILGNSMHMSLFRVSVSGASATSSRSYSTSLLRHRVTLH